MSELYRRVVDYTLSVEEQIRKSKETDDKSMDALLEEVADKNYPDELRKIIISLSQIFRCVQTAPRKIMSVPEIPLIKCPNTDVYHIYRPKTYVEILVDKMRMEKTLIGFNIQIEETDAKSKDYKIVVSW